LKIGETLFVEETGKHIRVEKMQYSKGLSSRSNPWTVFIDAEKVENKTLKVRNRRNGDRFFPLGMKGSKKLKDFMIDLKIEKEKRDSVLLVCDGDDILWVAGYRMSDICKLDSGTETVLKITVGPACYEK